MTCHCPEWNPSFVPPGSYRLRAFTSAADGCDDDDSPLDTADVARIVLAEKSPRRATQATANAKVVGDERWLQ
jgi:hypothetical protein